MNKTLKVMTSAALLAGVVAPVAVTTVSADSKNQVESTPKVSDNYKSTNSAPLTTLYIKEENIQFTSGDTFRISLSNADFLDTAYTQANLTALNAATANSAAGFNLSNVIATEKTLELTINGGSLINDNGKDVIKVPLFVDADEVGEIKATIEPLDSTLSPGTYVVGVAGDGNAAVAVEDVKTISENGGSISTVRIDEVSAKSLGNDNQVIKFKLPSKFDWDTASAAVTFTGSFAANGGMTATAGNAALVDGQYRVSVNSNNQELTLEFNPRDNRTNERGTIFVAGLAIDPEKDAQYGEVSVDISGTEIDDASAVVANYKDYGFVVEADGEPKEIVAGLHDDEFVLKTAKLHIKENLAGTYFDGNKTTVKFPSWVKVKSVKVTDAGTSEGVETPVIDADNRNEVEFVIDNVKAAVNSPTTKSDFNLEFVLSVQADKAGDIVAELDGRGGIEGEVLLAKAVAPVAVEVKATDVIVGSQEQTLDEIVISEYKKSTIKDDLTIELPEGLSWSELPKVEVDGNLTVDDVKLSDATSGGVDNILTIDIDGESTQASKVKLIGGKITLDRTVPVGPIKAKIGGGFIENSTADDSLAGNENKFEDKDFVAQVVVANVVTPAPGQSVSKEVKFTIGSTTYTVAGEEKTMDVAPFVEGSRTYMPIRYVAEAVGVDSDSIFWDQASSTATLIKGDRVVQLTNGSKSLKVNGASITMDAAAKVKDGRTVLPVRFVGQALGAQVEWNQADNTVTVK